MMPVCKECGEKVDELVRVRVGGRARRVCEECAEVLQEQEQIAEESEAVVQQMMGYRGRR
jgi:ribosome-binding protein aMBF1 (putative translation factor)